MTTFQILYLIFTVVEIMSIFGGIFVLLRSDNAGIK